MLLGTIYLSLDPYMRGRMNAGRSYARPVEVGEVMEGRAVGVAGGEKKCRHVTEELGFDACLDHRDPALTERLKEACPAGVDVYFENVGGKVFDAVFPLLNDFARVPVCGLIAHYNQTE